MVGDERCYATSIVSNRFKYGSLLGIALYVAVFVVAPVLRWGFSRNGEGPSVDYVLVGLVPVLFATRSLKLWLGGKSYVISERGLRVLAGKKEYSLDRAEITGLRTYKPPRSTTTGTFIDYRDAPPAAFDRSRVVESAYFPEYNDLVSDVASMLSPECLDIGTVALVELHQRAKAYLSSDSKKDTAGATLLRIGYARFARRHTVDGFIPIDYICLLLASRKGNIEATKAAVLHCAVQSSFGGVGKLCRKYPAASDDPLVRLCHAQLLVLLKHYEEARSQLATVLSSGEYAPQALDLQAKLSGA